MPRVVEVEIRRLSFGEPELTVPVGTTVRWINRDLVPHTTTSVDQVWNSLLIQPGARYEFTFVEEGDYDYHCVPHPFMTAKVRVVGTPELRESI